MIIIISLAIYLYIGSISQHSKFFYRSAFVLLFVFTLFRGRHMGGEDINVYINFFNNVVPKLSGFDWHFWSYSNEFDFGWGYSLLNSIAKTIYNDYFSFQALNTVVVFSLLGINIKKMKLDYNERCFFLFIYFCYEFFWYFFGLLRQNISNLIVWYIIIDLYQRKGDGSIFKYIKHLALIYIANLFHASGMLIFILYPIFILFDSIYPGSIKIGIVMIGSALIYFLGEGLFQPVVNMVVELSGDRYEMYTEMTAGGANTINFFIKYAFIIMMTFFNKLNKDGKYPNTTFINSTLYAIILGSINSAITLRVVEYFAIGYYAGTTKATYNSRFTKESLGLYRFMLFLGFLAILIRYVVFNAPYLLEYEIWSF